jgi:hypothetical protein
MRMDLYNTCMIVMCVIRLQFKYRVACMLFDCVFVTILLESCYCIILQSSVNAFTALFTYFLNCYQINRI